ncbi:hypothetical protein C9374_008594 [Naegleria lovaniensis]|uniref:Uncharacterized protein n=1 Tax=Naegleria lovaniensis TaxID=51637 RepID=A0AA88GIH2_NAELO|nr:uncharacterized protein C9374_008594 [Naegleria lovaniensis]KAG2377972.1 hypothetical protein C9374_008594 [Naegleria lovaniensis]
MISGSDPPTSSTQDDHPTTKKHLTPSSSSEFEEHKKRKIQDSSSSQQQQVQNKAEYLRGFLQRLRTWGLGATPTSVQALVSFLTNHSEEFFDDFQLFVENAQKIKERFAKVDVNERSTSTQLREEFVKNSLNSYGSDSFVFGRNSSTIMDSIDSGEVVVLVSDEDEDSSLEQHMMEDQSMGVTSSSTTYQDDDSIEDVTITSSVASSSANEQVTLAPNSKSNGRNWSREKWLTSLTEQLTNFNVDRLTEQQKKAYKTNSHYLLESTAKKDSNKRRYRNLFREFPALFYIYSYTNFIGRITMVKSIFEDHPDLKPLTELPKDKIIW